MNILVAHLQYDQKMTTLSGAITTVTALWMLLLLLLLLLVLHVPEPCRVKVAPAPFVGAFSEAALLLYPRIFGAARLRDILSFPSP